jgi:hypothetical protein
MLFTQAMIKFVGSFIQIWNAAKDETAVLRRENKIMKTNERKYLDISTAHLTQGTFGKLNSMHLPYAYNYDEGVFITVPSKNEIGTIIMPDDLRIVLQYAWDNDIDLIRMDRDAEVCDDLPVYEWSMENLQLAGRIWSCISDRYDDEEYKLGTLPGIVTAIEGTDAETLKDVLNKLCDRIEDMEEE